MDQLSDLLTGVGARDAYESKNSYILEQSLASPNGKSSFLTVWKCEEAMILLLVIYEVCRLCLNLKDIHLLTALKMLTGKLV